MIQIKDTGVGIAENELTNLFENFKKITENRSMNQQGCGLGLTLSKNIAQALGGDISVESEVGKGSIFSLTLKSSKPLNNLIYSESQYGGRLTK